MSWYKKAVNFVGSAAKGFAQDIVYEGIIKPVGDGAMQFGTFVLDHVGNAISTVWKATGLEDAWQDWVKSMMPEDQGFQIQKNFDSSASLPIVYGDSVKVAGTVIAKEVSSDYKFLHVFYAMSVEGADVTEIYIDGQAGNDAQWVYKPATNEYNSATRFNGKVSFKVANTSGGLGSTPTDLGCTIYNASIDLFDKMVVIYARYQYDREVYQGEPQIYAIMRSTDTSLSNPVNALKHYLTTSDYGAKIPSAKIDDTSFTAAAALCDELVTIPATGGTRKRYTFNTLLDTKNQISQNIGIIRFATDADIYFIDGKYSVKLKGQGDAVVTFDESNIVGDVSYSSQDDGEQFNVVVVNFTDASLNYKQNAAIYKSSDITYPFAGYASDFKALRDDGVEKEKRITLNGVTSFYEAQAFAEKFLKRSLFSRVCEVTTSWQTSQAQVGDIVGLTLEEFGFADKEFRVLEKETGLNGLITYKLMEHDDSVYSITYDNAEQSAGTITYPNPWAKLPAPTGLSITEIDGGKAQLNFTELDSGLVDTYVVEVVNQSVTSQVFRFFGNTSPIYFEVDTVGTFDVSVYAVSDLQINGTKSAAVEWVSAGFSVFQESQITLMNDISGWTKQIPVDGYDAITGTWCGDSRGKVMTIPLQSQLSSAYNATYTLDGILSRKYFVDFTSDYDLMLTVLDANANEIKTKIIDSFHMGNPAIDKTIDQDYSITFEVSGLNTPYLFMFTFKQRNQYRVPGSTAYDGNPCRISMTGATCYAKNRLR